MKERLYELIEIGFLALCAGGFILLAVALVEVTP